MMRGILLFLVLHFGCDVLGLLPLGEVLSNDGTRMGEEVRWFFFCWVETEAIEHRYSFKKREER
jgi:hypothetical protein